MTSKSVASSGAANPETADIISSDNPDKFYRIIFSWSYNETENALE